MTNSKVATVIVSHGNDRISIKSKSELTIDFTVLGITYTQAENNLFSRIERGPSPRPMELTYSELSTFKEAYNRFLQAQQIESKPIANVERVDSCKPSNVETAIPAPAPAPAITFPVSREPITAPVLPANAPTVPMETTAQVESAMQRIAKSILHDTIHRSYAPIAGNDEASRAERNIGRLQQAVDMLANDGHIMLQYDIPDRKKAVCPNPSHILWRYGFRSNLSVWILPQKSLKNPVIEQLLEHWNRNGINYLPLPIHDRAVQMTREVAAEYLREEIRGWHESLIENIGAAADRLGEAKAAVLADESKGTTELERAEDARNNAVRKHIRDAIERLETSIQCAELFDDNGDDTKALIDGLRSAIRSQAESFNAMARMRRIKPAPMPS